MEGKILFTYAAALVISFAASMFSVGNMIQVFKLDLQISDSEVRKDKLLWFVICGTLAPIGSAFALGFSFIDGFSLFTLLAGILMILQGVSVAYMASNVVPLPIAKPQGSNISPIKHAS